uniref:Ubiquinol oxidase (non-electrogenic) n=1 Tax=Ditylum brightwellii TaxID=49249 RepID=A0A7S1ZCP0_9STRA|mmetsp:Transcript_28938/g.43046  ORF Transcript_28938/g.43046 Transcript_28938/m.43046 type:complete len:318 (+) Transcript_28938:75-1028(+)
MLAMKLRLHLIGLASLLLTAKFETSAFTMPPIFAGKLLTKSAITPISPISPSITRATSPCLNSKSVTSGEDFVGKKNPSGILGEPLNEDIEEFNRNIVGFIKKIVFDILYRGEGREYARFYALETIAREPYFAYLGALHFYETAGVWRKANYLKIHFAEEWNELHHLLIMEELGGADKWIDRFIAQHIAVAYYWIVLAMYFYNPTLAYNLNQAVEEHAYATYDQFLNKYSAGLKEQPAPQVALDYYRDGDLYMFDEFQTDTCESRRPVINNLYDVFVAIRDDEAEHVKTMKLLQADVELQTSNDGTCEAPPELLLGA